MLKLGWILFVAVAITTTSAQAEKYIRRGKLVTGNNGEYISVAVAVNTANKAREVIPVNNAASVIYINNKEMEGSISAEGIASSYDKTPVTYFYFEIILKPKTNSDGLVILSQFDATTMMCPKGANALLVSYKGNGTSQKDCVFLGEPQPLNQ